MHLAHWILGDVHLASELLTGNTCTHLQSDEGIPLTTTGPTDQCLLDQTLCGRKIDIAPGVLGQRSRVGQDTDECPDTYRGTTVAHQTTGTRRDLTTTFAHLVQHQLEIDHSPGISVCGQQRGTHCDMMLEIMYPKLAIIDNLHEHLIWIGRGGFQTDLANGFVSGLVQAFSAHLMSGTTLHELA